VKSPTYYPPAHHADPMSMTSNGFPKLRPLDIRHHRQNGQEYILLRDPLQLSDKTLLVP
jgi:hypothetical protein